MNGPTPIRDLAHLAHRAVAGTLVLALLATAAAVLVRSDEGVEAVRVVDPGPAASSGGPPYPATDVVHREPAWKFLEEQARVLTAEMYGVPDDERLRTWGKPQIEANLFTLLMIIVNTPPADRTPQEQAAYDALASRYRTNRIDLARQARDEYGLWQQNPCTYRPAAGVPYEPPTCSPLGGLFGGPSVPSADDFASFAAARALNPALRASSGAQSYWDALVALSYNTAAVTSLASALYPALVDSLLAFKIAQAVSKGITGGLAAEKITEAVAIAFGAKLAVGAVAIEIMAVTIAVTRLLDVLDGMEVLPTLEENLARAYDPVSLEEVASSDGGLLLLFNAFYETTVVWEDGQYRRPAVDLPPVAFEPDRSDGTTWEETPVDVDGEPVGASRYAPTFLPDADRPWYRVYREGNWFVVSPWGDHRGEARLQVRAGLGHHHPTREVVHEFTATVSTAPGGEVRLQARRQPLGRHLRRGAPLVLGGNGGLRGRGEHRSGRLRPTHPGRGQRASGGVDHPAVGHLVRRRGPTGRLRRRHHRPRGRGGHGGMDLPRSR